jgi:NitT/TauT family transport system permease protein
MLIVILLYDQLLFRPLVAWSAKFRFELTASEEAEDPWVLKLLRRTRLLRAASALAGRGFNAFGGLRMALTRGPAPQTERPPSRLWDAVFLLALAAALGWALWLIAAFAAAALSWGEALRAVGLGLLTMVRVVVLMIMATLVWVPIGVWLGLRPVWGRRVQPLAQFLAAFPANLFFPIFVVLIVRFAGSPDIWLTPLMILGTQWYILFNVIAGASAFPGDLKEAARNFRVGGWLWWRRVILPGVFPYYVTGAITASGGSWNAAIVAEVASWGDTRLTAHGLGAYIAEATADGDTARVVLGVAVMSAYVVAFNRLLWRPLYGYSTRRLTLG